MDRLDQIVMQSTVVQQNTHRVVLRFNLLLDLHDEFVQMASHLFQFAQQLVGVTHHLFGVCKHIVDRRLNAINQVIHLNRHLVQAFQALPKLRVGSIQHHQNAVFQGLSLHKQGLEAFLEFRVHDRLVQGLLHRFQEYLRRVANLAHKTKGFGNDNVIINVATNAVPSERSAVITVSDCMDYNWDGVIDENDLRAGDIGFVTFDVKQAAAEVKRPVCDIFDWEIDKNGTPTDKSTAKLPITFVPGGKMTVQMNDKTGKYDAYFSPVNADGARMTLSNETRDITGGLILRRGSIEANCSVELLVELCRGELSSQLADILFK